MKQEELNKLKVGEKAVDIQEYYWGPNGKILAYKVTIYTCVKYLLFFKKIKEFTFPFYFVSKEFALEFLKVYEKYEFEYQYINFSKTEYATKIYIKNIQNQKYNYVLISAYHKLSTAISQSDTLINDGVWAGKVCEANSLESHYQKTDCFDYTFIIEKEKLAAKEGTTGKTYSFKMIEENEN